MIATFAALAVGVLVTVSAIPLVKDLLRLEVGVSHRGEIWNAAIKMLRESPLFGKGPGAFNEMKYTYMSINTRAFFGAKANFSTHNLLLLRACELGLVGAISLVLFWLTSVIIIIKNTKFVKDTDLFPIFAGCCAIFIGSISRSFFESGGNYLVFLALAVIINAPRLAGRRRS